MAAVAQMAPHERISNITKLSSNRHYNQRRKCQIGKDVSIISDAETKSEKTIVFSNFNEILLMLTGF